MKPNREDFDSMNDDWIHAEVLNSRGKKGGSFVINLIVGGVLIAGVVVAVLGFQNLFNKNDRANLENLDSLASDKAKEEADLQNMGTQAKLDATKAEEDAKKKAEDEAKANEVKYKVQSGDTLAQIAEKYGITWQKIAEANNMKEPYGIEIDQELIIPGVKPEEVPATKPEDKPATAPATTTTTTPPATSGKTYTVKSGDTFAEIGASLNIDWKKIAEVNDLKDPYALEVDQVLKLP